MTINDWNLIKKLVFIASCASISACLQVYADYFIYWRDLVFREPWRLWSAHWVHVGWIHYLLNMLAFSCLPFIFPYIRIRNFFFLLIVLAPLISLSFYYILPSVEAYAGLSGVLHGLYVAGAVIYSQYKRERKFALLVFSLILAKLLWENTIGQQGTAELIGSPVLVEAHLLGVFWGTILALIALVYRRRKIKIGMAI